MINIVQGDALNVEKGIIVHGCNCLGVMGAGIALAVKNRYPAAYQAYRKQHENGGAGCGLELGSIIPVQVDDAKWIINAMTQPGVGGNNEDDVLGRCLGHRAVSYDAVTSCFEDVNVFARGIEHETGECLPIVFPKIGAGLGGGNWAIIESIIDNSIDDRFLKILFVL